MFIHEEDIQEFFFERLVAAGLAPQSGDLEVISDITFDYLIELGILHPDNIYDEGDMEDYEE